MTRNRHHRLRDHFGLDYASNVTYSGGTGGIDTVQEAIADLYVRAGFSGLTVRDFDGSPTISSTNIVTVSGATVTTDAAGHAIITITGGGGPHATDHENGGSDEIDLAGLDGIPTELANHLADSTDAHDASAISFTPTGTIAATDVQAAIAEVASEAGSGVTLSNATPLVESGAGDEGTASDASRSDHVHPADGGGGGGTTLEPFGDGQDGDVVINSGTFNLSVGGTALISNNILARDAYFHDLTLNGGDLFTFGRRVFVSGTLTLTSGVIRNDGAAGSAGGNGSAGAGGSLGAGASGTTAGTTVSSSGGLAGTAGGFNAAAANPAAAAAILVGRTQMPAGAAGGASGQGQAGGQRAATTTTNTQADRSAWTDMLRAMAFRDFSNTAPGMASFLGQAVAGGGGGGAASSGGGGGGGSGAGGGPLIVAADTIVGTTNIRALGGAGGNGGNGGGTNAGGGAGGNGGAGGWIVFVYRDQTGWSGTLDVSGGTGGTGGTGVGTGSSGGNGSAGNAGITKEWQV